MARHTSKGAVVGVRDDENPEWTAEEIRSAQRGGDVFPEMFRRRGQQKAPTKQPVSLRLDVHIVAAFRATGKGWQGRINQTLAEHLPRRRRIAPTAKPLKRRRATK